MADQKFIFIQLRGGMDGLAALRPDDQSVLKTRRPDLLAGKYFGTKAGFAFNPVLKNHHRLFQNKELSFLHACGLSVQDRSHFKSQDLLETGKIDANARTGWLAQILEQMPRSKEGVAFGPTLPMILSGSNKVFNWSSPRVVDEDEALMKMLGKMLYKDDPVLSELYPQFERIEHLTGGFNREKRSSSPFEVIGNMLSKSDGPDIGVINLGNWDTHDNQNARIAKEFKNLDDGLGTLKKTMRKVWDDTIIVTASEFGRSVHQNGTDGSDHGTGGVCMIAGGAVDGGRSLGAWPGLESKDLFEDRDVMPVHDIRTVFANIADAHLGMKAGFIKDIFPKLPASYDELPIVKRKKRLFGFV